MKYPAPKLITPLPLLHSSHSEVPRSEVKLAQLITADGKLPEGRASSEDVRIGDIISVRVESLYSPYGDMQVRAVLGGGWGGGLGSYMQVLGGEAVRGCETVLRSGRGCAGE